METRESRQNLGALGVLVDTNLLIVLLVGLVRRELVGKGFRTDNYGPEDFDLLLSFVKRFDHLAATPQVLAELTNLLPLARKDPYANQVLASMVQVLTDAKEQHVPKDVMLGRPDLLGRIGFTDLSLLEAAKAGYLVLTDDFRCTYQLRAEGCQVVNLSQLRTQEWFG